MKTTEVVKKDPRLLFFQALDNGLHNGLIKGSFIEALEKEVAEMGLRFAGRYYSIIYQAYLEQAVRIVLGVINLGLLKESRGDLDIALKKIIEHKTFNLFRLGWSQVEALVKIVEKVDSAEKEEEFGPNINLAELMAEAVANHFAMEVGEIWNGVEEYRRLTVKYGALAERQEFQRWLIRSFWKKNQMPFYPPEMEIKTIFASLLAAETAHAPVNLADCKKIADMIGRPKLKQCFLEKASVIRKIVPAEWLKIFDEEAEQFYRLTLQYLKKKGYRPEEFVNFCQNEFDIDLEPESYDQDVFNETVKMMREHSDDELLEMLSGTIDDPIARMAMVECITSRRRKLTSKDILTLFRDVPLKELVGQISWHEMDWKIIERVIITSENLNEITRGIMLQDVYQSAVLNPTEVKKDWWSKMPLSLAFPMFLAIDPADRPTLLEKIRVPAEEIVRVVHDNHDTKYFALARPDDWYIIWVEFEPMLTGKKLLAFLSDEERLLILDSTEKINYLARIVEAIAQEWQKRPELRQYASPFWAEGLKGAVKSILDDKEFERLIKKLKVEGL